MIQIWLFLFLILSIFKKKKNLHVNKINLKILNYLKLSKPDKKKFPALKILNLVPEKDSLFETILVSANDELVDYFLQGKIKFNNIYKYLFKIINLKEFEKYFQKKPNDIHQIQKLIEEVRLKTRELCIKWILNLWKKLYIYCYSLFF